EAEAVAATDCSGHGRVFLDGVAGEDGRPTCECNACFGGPDCSLRTPNCTADADSGNPLFLEPYWRRHPAAGAVVFSGWHRMSYVTTDGGFQSVELENHIRRLHRAVGNAVVDEKHLVFAAGSIQLINALVHALSVPDANAASPPARVVANAPYYPAYRVQTDMFDGREYRWAGTTARWANTSRANSTAAGGCGFIELVTSPNNPDAMLREPALAVAGGGDLRPRLLLAALHAHPGAGRRGRHALHHVQAFRPRRQQIRMGADQGRCCGREGARVRVEQHHGRVP
ncbi:unnamed protein product, partial [Urochloa humidicola]